MLRANVAPNATFEPFFYIGAGWTRFHVTGTAGRDVRSPDHVLEIPFGLGVARRFGRLVLDARAGVSVMTGADLVPQPDPEPGPQPGLQQDPVSRNGENMHRAGVHVSVGFDL